MTVKLDIQEFVKDYCTGVRDKDLLVKHHINPKELMAIVRKLINDGLISKEQYFDRNRMIQELESREEKNFLKSLYHCPVCSHIQPSPFTVCPACGTDVAREEERDQESREQEPLSAQNLQQSTDRDADLIVIDGNTAEPDSPKPVPQVPLEAAVETVPASQPSEELLLPPDLEALIECPLVSVSPIGESSMDVVSGSYDIVEAISHDHGSSIFKALDSSGQGPDLNVKLFHIDSLPEESVAELLNRVLMYQSAMRDQNILKVLGSAVVDGREALIYEHMPSNLESLVRDHPEGIPFDLLMEILPQILNSVGYSHMHRGTDGVARRLPHMCLRPAKFLFDPDTRIVKLDECGLWKSIVEVCGFKRHMWEEPNVSLATLAPECFVLNGKFVNAFFADIYALGVTLYRVATGKWPFVCPGMEEYHFAHLRTFPVPPRVHRWQIPGWLDRMILKCLEKEPPRRWRSATQMELAIGKGLE
ncbi:MAG: protein kinase [Desulfomonile tiedjei]|uniref:Protein kinase n=1 Tax=Desulfomonile tiedjei TaxID=2358 RepID=A0A9D6Z273_9BACT|nr:protein kinase [Desulfomonile tiedjei]